MQPVLYTILGLGLYSQITITSANPVLKWHKSNLTWVYLNTTAHDYPLTMLNLSQTDVRQAIHSGLSQWSRACPLNFKEDAYNAKADIKVSFMEYDHGDGFNVRNAFAHAFFPPHGEIHLNNNITWSYGSLEYVLLHELGHALGLIHNNNKDSVMYPYHQDKNITTLSDIDTEHIQRLYGARKVEVRKEIAVDQGKITYNSVTNEFNIRLEAGAFKRLLSKDKD